MPAGDSILLLICLLLPRVAHGGCAHEATSRAHGGVRDLGYFYNRRVPYEAHNHARRLQSASWQPIRVHVEYGSLSALSSAQRTHLQSTLMPSAVAWVESALSVIPVSGMLQYGRSCDSVWPSNGVCRSSASTQSDTCGRACSLLILRPLGGPLAGCWLYANSRRSSRGRRIARLATAVASDGSERPVPAAFLRRLSVCSSGPDSGCSTLPGGPGVSADFVLFVGAVEHGSMPHRISHSDLTQRTHARRVCIPFGARRCVLMALALCVQQACVSPV
jgi:hypothetical protein